MKRSEFMALVGQKPLEWRYGQAVFNYAYALWPAIANELRGGPLDCFHFSDRIEAFLGVFAEHGVLVR